MFANVLGILVGFICDKETCCAHQFYLFVNVSITLYIVYNYYFLFEWNVSMSFIFPWQACTVF